LIAIVLVLCSVFIPVAFLGGIAGQLYKQFAVTVAVAVVISGFTALTLTPATATVDRKSTRLNSSHSQISYAVFCLKKKNKQRPHAQLALRITRRKRQPLLMNNVCHGDQPIQPPFVVHHRHLLDLSYSRLVLGFFVL